MVRFIDPRCFMCISLADRSVARFTVCRGARILRPCIFSAGFLGC